MAPPVRRIAWFRLGLLSLCVLILLAVAAASSILAWSFYDPDPQQLQRLKTGCGAKGVDFEVLCPDGIPLLVMDGLPVTTPFDSSSEIHASLDGLWDWRLDPLEIGETGEWGKGLWFAGESEPLTIPSTYNAPSSKWLGHQGPTWYRRCYPSESAEPGWRQPGWRQFVRFDGVLLRACAWFNGVALGCHEGGYTAFRFEVTGLSHSGGQDTLVVRADNRLTWHSMPPRVRVKHNPVWGVYGGIYRSVFLESVPPSRLLKAAPFAYAETKDSGFKVQAVVEITSRDSGSERWDLHCSWFGPEGDKLGDMALPIPEGLGFHGLHFHLPVAHPRTWGPGHPDLYRLSFELRQGDSALGHWTLLTGYRNLSVAQEEMRIDGKKAFLRGISKMEDDPMLGQSQTAEIIQRDLEWVDSLRANFIRLAHYPHHHGELLEARDRGLWVSEEIPFFHIGVGWSQWLVDFQEWRHFPARSFGMRQLRDTLLLQLAQRSLFEMIERDVANPAVLFWSLGNETYSLGKASGEVYAWLRRSALAFDPTRPSALAEMTFYQPWLDVFRHGSDSLDLVTVNAYYGWYFGEAEDIGEELDALHRRYPGKPMILTECGAEAALGRHTGVTHRRGDRVFFPRPYTEEYQAEVLATHWRAVRERPFMAGISPWVLADFYCPWFPRNPVPNTNNKGILTRERQPKLGFWKLRELYGEVE